MHNNRVPTSLRLSLRENYPFAEFQPVFWDPRPCHMGDPGSPICSVKRDHGVGGRYRLHNPRDEINDHRPLAQKVLIEYRIGNNSYDLFTVGDFFDVPFAFVPKAGGNIVGDLAERIARRITKYFLKHFSKEGYTGGIFDKRFNPQQRDNFIVTHTDKYVLKIDKYPNLVILKRTGRGKYGYENIKELDGLFDFRFGNDRHILVLESKLDRISVDCEDLVDNLFVPLRHLLPEARFSYVVFSNRESIYVKKNFQRLRVLKHMPQKIHRHLVEQDIGVIFFTFNESYDDFERMKDHLITQYRSVSHQGVALNGRMIVSDREIILFDQGQTPHLKLIRDHDSGLWKEVKLTHKKKNK